MSKTLEPNIRLVEEDWLMFAIYINDKHLSLNNKYRIILHPTYVEDFEDEDNMPDINTEPFNLYLIYKNNEWIKLSTKGRPIQKWENILKIICKGGYYNI